VPPLTGVAVNNTGVPEQMLVAVAAMETAGVRALLTVMFTGVATAVAGDAHVMVDVMIQLTASPLFSAALVYVGLLVPTFDPLSNH
jgi:hypothetical protein